MIYFTGDINLTDNSFDVGYGVGSSIKKGINPFHNINKKPGDIWIGNFEGVTSSTTNAQGYCKDSFRIDPNCLKDIKLIDYWGVANNHTMEHGPDAFNEMVVSLSSLSKGVFGSSNKHSIMIEVDGKYIAISAFSLRNDQLQYATKYWNFPTEKEIIEECRIYEEAVMRIAYVHWGVEFINYPYWEQRKLAHMLIDSGYDLIIGMHPHVLQGFEVYKGKYIFYSLGNFVFNQGWAYTKYGIVVKLELTDLSISFDYIKIQNDFAPKFIGEDNVPIELRMETLNTMINSNFNLEVYVLKANRGLSLHRKYNHRSILKNLYRNDKKALLGILIGYLNRRIKK